jgi:uncharacterized protein YhaN
LGDGLTVVLGPNEAGKSSFTALVRYLLYGFPTEKSVSERPYLSDAGPREGRLVFESAEGEWAVERVSGPRGGPSSVHAVRGPERPGLITDITSGVSEQAFKVVFGFGLAEMAAIERLRGTDDDIIARLYAAGAGLSVSPQEVRAAMDVEAEALYRPRGSKPAINALAATARDLRVRLSGLEREAEALAADREHLSQLAEELRTARAVLDEASLRHRTLTEEHRVLADLEDTVRAAEEELLGLRRAARDAAAAAEKIVVDETVIEASTEISQLTEDLSAFRQRLDTVRELEERITSLTTESAERLVEAGVDAETAARVDLTPETRAGVERWREQLLTLEQRARDAAQERDETAEESSVAAVAASGTTADAPAVRGGAGPVAWVAAGLGVVLAGIGIYYGQWLAGLAGAALAAFAVLQGLAGRGGPVTRTADSIRLADRAADLAQRAEKTALAAERAERQAAETRAEWLAWLEERGLAGLTEPAAVVRVLELVADARRIESERVLAAERLAREVSGVEEFIERVTTTATALEMGPPADAREAEALAMRLKDRIAAARQAGELAAGSRAEAEKAAAAVADAEARQTHAATRAQEIIERLGVSGGLVELSAIVDQAGVAAQEAQDRWGELKSEHASLETRIGEREREDTMGSLRLELASVNERIAQNAERYAELSIASRLLQHAQERYERERQPEVVREAERIFGTITGGGYARLSVPLGSSAIEVFDRSARSKQTGLLSTGTAEQLYLALRLALIGQLGETGAALPVLMDDVFANFDPERKAGAAAAVAELARARQVVVFTCHPETAAVLADAEPELTSLSLDRC